MAELLSWAKRNEQVAIADDESRLTWVELDRRVNQWIRVLRGWGLRAGDRVAVVAGNAVPTYEVLLACLHANLVVVPVNWHLTASEIAGLLADSRSRAVVTDALRAATAARAIADLPAPPPLQLVFGDHPVGAVQPIEPLLAGVGYTEPVGQSCGTLMLYTSGTTGTPRGVLSDLLPVGRPMRQVRPLLAALGTGPIRLPDRDPVLLIGPWYHAAPLFFSLFPLLRGASLIMRGRFNASALLRVVDSERIACTHLVPTQFVRLLRLPAAERAAFHGVGLRRVWHGGGPCDPQVKQAMIDWWGPVLTEYYGATEAGIVATIDSIEWSTRRRSVGRPVAGTELLVVDEAGQPLPLGHPGRIFVRRRSGGMSTCGDLGYLDADGYLYLTGRTTGIIVSGGVSIHPDEVETVLRRHPDVVDAAVFGVPDEEFGQRVAAAVEVDPAAGHRWLAHELDEHCRRMLAGFKVPHSYQFVATLPRDESGKLRQAVLRTVVGAREPPG